MKKIRKNKIRNKIRKIALSIAIVGFTLLQDMAYSQPAPGDAGLQSEPGGVVGGGADLTTNIGFMLLLALVYAVYKQKENIRNYIFL